MFLYSPGLVHTVLAHIMRIWFNPLKNGLVQHTSKITFFISEKISSYTLGLDATFSCWPQDRNFCLRESAKNKINFKNIKNRPRGQLSLRRVKSIGIHIHISSLYSPVAVHTVLAHRMEIWFNPLKNGLIQHTSKMTLVFPEKFPVKL